MIFYPAIDIRHGQCIRLQKGELSKIKVYNQDPVNQATQFSNMGCEWIHIVDIDGAFNGTPCNQKVIFEIKKKTKCNVQVGGGVRSIKIIEEFFLNSIDRVILGTIAKNDPQFVIEACKKFPGKIVVGIDSKDNMVAVEGWSKTSSITTIELARRYEGVGVSSIIFTDINKDGLLKGMNFKQIVNLLDSTKINVIASGGVSSLEDLEKLKNLGKENLEGVISGKAIYEGKFNVQDAIKTLC